MRLFKRHWKRNLWLVLGLGCFCSLVLGIATVLSLRPLPSSLRLEPAVSANPRLLDRDGTPLSGPHVGGWNIYDVVPLQSVPEFLQQAFLMSEDRRFYVHGGADWEARVHALWQNLVHLHVVRGASTISEQVVRILQPRPRTYWSRWVEGFEAHLLEKRFSKAAILEFYLNEVPYASQRRGVVEAARWYFDRDLETLSEKEMLALAVMVRAPSYLDLYHDPEHLERPVEELARKMQAAGLMSKSEVASLPSEPWVLDRPKAQVDASAFSNFVLSHHPPMGQGSVRTTLELGLQRRVQELLNARLHQMKLDHVHNAAALVVDNSDNSIIAWAVGGQGGTTNRDVSGSLIDAVLTPRQPGSTLKPFLYALALEKGWTPATLIDDSRMVEPVGHGLHAFRNYSGVHYGHITLRDALGNSLNIPAVRTVEFVGPAKLLDTLDRLGIKTLDEDPGYYGDALALGDGAVTLYGLVQAYSTLARGGVFVPLTTLADVGPQRQPVRIFSEEASSLIANILSDPSARRLEFGQEGLLDFPVQTAVKTGTSSDYHDSWTVGFDSRYTVGVWMGNLDYAPMNGVTGSIGPALVLRGIFATLNERGDTSPLYLSPKLVERHICVHEDFMPSGQCIKRTEWFMPGTAPREDLMIAAKRQHTVDRHVHFETPSDGLMLAYDPRIPKNDQAFLMTLNQGPNYEKVAWYVDGRRSSDTHGPDYVWPVSRGHHTVSARVWLTGKQRPIEISKVAFTVR